VQLPLSPVPDPENAATKPGGDAPVEPFEGPPQQLELKVLARLYGEPMLQLPSDLYIPPDALEVFLDAFEGPLDLLLYLIRKHNFNILDIPMAEVTRQYLVYVDQIRRHNLELAAEYLLMAALLIDIKSRMLLPVRKADTGEEVEDPRAELARRLLEYERIKLGAQQIDHAPQIGRDFHAAQVHLEQTMAARLPQVDVVRVRDGMFGASGNGDTSGYGGLLEPIATAPATSRPFGGDFDEIADELGAALAESSVGFDEAIEKVVVDRDEITFQVRREELPAVAQTLRDDPDLRFELCSSVSGVHYPNDTGRELHAVYHLLSITHGRRVRLEVTCPDADPHIPSLVSVYPTADWQEREAWDFFGIQFDGHPSLTRIQMPDDWPGHPQRKDYPLGGIPVEYKGATIPPPDIRRSYS